MLDLAGPKFLPLRTFRDDNLLDAGSDPLLALLGALGAVGDGEGVVARLVLHPLGVDWSRKHQRRALVPALSLILNPAYQYQTRTLLWEGVALIPLLGLVAVGLQNRLWLREGHLLWAVLFYLAVAAGVVASVPLLVGLYRRATRHYDIRLIQENVSRAAYRAELHLTAIVPEGQGQDRAEALLLPLATAYHHHDLASGNARRDGGLVPGMPADPLALSSRRSFDPRMVLNTREVAALWRLPRGGEEVPLMERTGARLLLPLARGVRDGALVGTTTSYGEQREVRFPDDPLRQHHLYVAKTRMGKSTLMQQVVAYKLHRKAQGLDTVTPSCSLTPTATWCGRC